MKKILLTVIISCLLVACKPAIPRGILKPSKMEAVLYDYHLAENLPIKGSHTAVTREMQLQSVFQKHGITQKQFDESMAYYARHTSKLLDIYKSIDERYTEQYLAMGGEQTIQRQFQSSLSGDTLDIWNQRRNILLFPQHPYQSFAFEIPIDTAFYAGDIILLQFDTDFIFSAGQRSAVAVLNVTTNTDSVMVANAMPSSSSHYQLRLQDLQRKGIKRIHGYFMLNNPGVKTTAQSMQALLLKNIQLVRIHTKQNKEQLPVDTLNNTLPPDTDVPTIPSQEQMGSNVTERPMPVATPSMADKRHSISTRNQVQPTQNKGLSMQEQRRKLQQERKKKGLDTITRRRVSSPNELPKHLKPLPKIIQ